MRPERPNAATLKARAEDLLNLLGFHWIDDQLAILQMVPKGYASSHPHAFALGSRDLVPDPFSSNLPLKLRERQQHVQCQTPHGRGRIELLRDRDEAHVAG